MALWRDGFGEGGKAICRDGQCSLQPFHDSTTVVFDRGCLKVVVYKERAIMLDHRSIINLLFRHRRFLVYWLRLRAPGGHSMLPQIHDA